MSWNTRDLLATCLESMRADADSGRATVWVVDNGSSDGSVELVRDRFPWVELVASDENLGFGRAVNLVAERTESDWVAPANADVELTRGALEALLRAGEAHPGAGAVAPRLILPDGSIQSSVQGFPSLRSRLLFHTRAYKLDRGLGERWLLADCWDPERPRAVDWATGAFLIVRRGAFEAVGGFEDDQWMYAEDLDLGWRLARAGWTTRYEPAATVHHHHSAAASQAFGAEDAVSARWMRATYAWMMRRHGAPFTWAHAGLDTLEALARVAVLTPLARVSPGRWAARRDRARASVPLFRIGLASRQRLLGEAHRPVTAGPAGERS